MTCNPLACGHLSQYSGPPPVGIAAGVAKRAAAGEQSECRSAMYW